MATDKVQTVHCIGIIYTVSLVTWLYLTGIFITMPVFYKDVSTFYYGLMHFLAVFIVFNTIANLYLTRKCDSFYSGKQGSGDDALLDSKWVKCMHCVRMAPPRSHHCGICQRCVLKRDHHCFVTGTCIGLRNQRYFLMFLLYCDIGILYSSYMAWYYIYTHYHLHPLSTSIIHIIPPITLIEWLLGYVTGDFFHIALLVAVCFSTVAGTLLLAAVQIVMIVLGTTGYEFKKRVWRYNRGVYQNIKDALGPCWLLHFVFPLPYVAEAQWRNTKLV